MAPLLRDVRRGPGEAQSAERDLLRGRRRGEDLERDCQHQRLAALYRSGRPRLTHARWRRRRGIRLREGAGRLADRRALRYHQPAADGSAHFSPVVVPDDCPDIRAHNRADGASDVVPDIPADCRAHDQPDVCADSCADD